MSDLRQRLSVVLVSGAALVAMTIVTYSFFSHSGFSSFSSANVRGGGAPTSAPRRESTGDLASPDQPAPNLEFSKVRLDLRVGKPNEIARGELTLINKGVSAIEFSLQKHCGCTELMPLAGLLEPGAQQTIRVGVQLPDHANAEKTTSIEALAGNPRVVVARCEIIASNPAPFRVTPAAMSFGALDRDELRDAVREVHLESLDKRSYLDPSMLLIDHRDNAFQVKCMASTASDSTPHLPRSQAVLRVTLRPDMPYGNHYDTIDLRLAGSDIPLRIPLNVTVTEPIMVVPSTVVLRKPGKDKSLNHACLLIIAHGNRELGAVSLVDGPTGLKAEDMGSEVPGRRRARVYVDGPTAAWPRKTQVRLKSAGASESFGFTLLIPPE